MKNDNFPLFIHLSQFCSYFLPFLGIIVPYLMWKSQKDEEVIYDIHGRIVLNWIISLLIYFVLSMLMIIIVIGPFLLVILAICGIAFPIIGARKAQEGEIWKYPLSIDFLGVNKLIEDSGM